MTTSLLAKVERACKDIAADRRDAVEQLLDARPDLNVRQRARLREIGVTEGPSKLRQWLTDVLPAPESGGRGPIGRAGSGARLLKGNEQGSGDIRPSSNEHLNRLFRMRQGDPDDDGVRVSPTPGVLVTFSVAQAFPKIKAMCKARVEQESADMARRRDKARI